MGARGRQSTPRSRAPRDMENRNHNSETKDAFEEAPENNSEKESVLE